MKKQDVKIGKVYLVTVSGKRARVRLTNESPYGGWDGLNIDTKRKVRIKSPQRLQREIKDPEARAGRPEPEPEAILAQPEVEDQEVQAAAEEPTADEPVNGEPDQEPAEAQQNPEPDPEPQAAPEAAQAADTPPEQSIPDQEPEATAEAPSAADTPQDAAPSATGAPQETRLSKLTIPELQALYADVVGRPSQSSNSSYLQWKIRQARKGKVPTGPRRERTASAASPHRVLPLRMEENLVSELDEARQRLGLPSRMALFRSALHAFLLEAGEVRVAEMFAPSPEA